jgi:hypothetical protein
MAAATIAAAAVSGVYVIKEGLLIWRVRAEFDRPQQHARELESIVLARV